jgi:protoporphyrin/coproporphyrin ferrochelatase
MAAQPSSCAQKVSEMTTVVTEAVLLLAHGTPDLLGEMEAYLKLVTGGRGVPPHVVEELQERYATIGLRDEPTPEGPHLTRWTMRQAALLQERLGQPVYVAMRNWKPFIPDVVAQMKRDGIKQMKAICLAPQNSRTSIGLYRRAPEDAVNSEMEVEFLPAWADHPLLVRAFAERMQPALELARAAAPGGRVAALFTAHSVPARTIEPSSAPVEYHGLMLANGPDSYADECRHTAKLITAELDALHPGDCYFSFQSQGLSGGPWIGPTVEETLVTLKHEGYEAVVIQPVGFLCDHVEILYDIDVAFQQTAQQLGLKLARAESLNDSPGLMSALENLALSDGVKEKYRENHWVTHFSQQPP